MKVIFTYLICVFLVCQQSAAFAQKGRPVREKPLTARFTVDGTYEETYSAAKTGADGSFKNESKLKVEFRASNWVVIGKNEVGNVEFQPLQGPTGSQHADASGMILLDAVTDGQSPDGSSLHAIKKFSGPIATATASLSTPYLTELGDGIGFNFEMHSRLTGLCDGTRVDSDHTRHKIEGCDNGVVTGDGITGFEDNSAGKTADTPFAGQYSLQAEMLPEIYQIDKLKADGELNANDPFAAGRLERLNEASRQKAAGFGMPRWFGLITKGGRSSGWQLAFTGTRDHPTNGTTADGGKQDWTQRLTIKAEINPNAALGMIDGQKTSFPGLTAHYSSLTEVGIKPE